MVKGEIRKVGKIDEDWLAEIVARYKDSDGFTANPSTKHVYNAMIIAEGKRLYDELIRTSRYLKAGPPIYLIAIINNRGAKINNLLREGYKEASRLTDQPLFGYWLTEKKIPYLDAVIAAQYINRAMAKREGRKYDQEKIFELRADGSNDTISTN